MMGIKLQRTIKVSCWRVIGQVAKAAKRTELMPVLLRARERGETDARDVAGHLFFESDSRRVVAQRLLQIAELYGLLEQEDRRYRLTKSGEMALATEQVFVPEHGTWTVWASDDPLLATPILRVEPWAEPTAYDEVWGEERDNARDRPFEEVPSWVRDAIGVLATPLVGGGQLRLDQLEAEGEVAAPETTLRATWDVSGARLRVNGTLAGARVNAAIEAPELDEDDVWAQLLKAEGLWPQWDASAQAMRIDFGKVSPGERESLVRAVTFRLPDITSVGPFDATTVEGVPLRARSAPDAKRWAVWRLQARLGDYATEERFSRWMAEAVAPFAEFNPATPTRAELARAAWRASADRRTPTAWHLVAAEDWSL